MCLGMVFTARPTEKMRDFLSIFSLWHNAFSRVSRTSGLIERAAFPEALAGSDASVTCYRSAENILVMSIVEPKDELIQVQRQILSAHAVIRADYTAFQQTPERFNRVGMDRPTNVFTARVA